MERGQARRLMECAAVLRVGRGATLPRCLRRYVIAECPPAASRERAVAATHCFTAPGGVFADRRRRYTGVEHVLRSGEQSLGVDSVDHAGVTLRVTGPERTLVDAFRTPRWSGGMEELVESAAGFGVRRASRPAPSRRSCGCPNSGSASSWRSSIGEPHVIYSMSRHHLRRSWRPCVRHDSRPCSSPWAGRYRYRFTDTGATALAERGVIVSGRLPST